jgi:hypothetical protein
LQTCNIFGGELVFLLKFGNALITLFDIVFEAFGTFTFLVQSIFELEKC